jgi:hypothetical protein
MKKTILFFFSMVLLSSAFSQVNSSNTYVDGYYRSNGTYVQGHFRTTPNYTINDNYSTYPNINPYTGKAGTVMPRSYSYPSYYNTSRSVYSNRNYYY